MSERSTVLVVGGAGYIGAHVNKALARRGTPTVVYDNLCTGHEEFLRWGEFERGDIRDADRLKEVMRRHDIGAVLHFASSIQVGESVSDPAKYWDNNLAGTLSLLQAMRRAEVDALIFSSTAAVYGMPEGGGPITEDSPLAPINPYGWTKRAAEQMMADFGSAYGLRTISLRYFNAAGADAGAEIGEWHVPETHLIPLVLDAALGRRPHAAVFGDDYPTPDGSCLRDYIHVEDLAEAHLLALDRLLGGGEGGVFNLGNGSGFSVLEVIEAARRVTGRPIPARMEARRLGDPPRLVASSARARQELGWSPSRQDLHGIVESAWKWHRRLHG